MRIPHDSIFAYTLIMPSIYDEINLLYKKSLKTFEYFYLEVQPF